MLVASGKAATALSLCREIASRAPQVRACPVGADSSEVPTATAWRCRVATLQSWITGLESSQ